LMITQIVAIPCTIFFAKLAKKIGTRNALFGGIGIYVLVCLVGFYMGFSLENAALATEQALALGDTTAPESIYQPALRISQGLFWLLAIMVGTSQGGLQALSRSQFGRMIPPERSNEFFGFFSIFAKFATMLGPLLYAFLVSFTGRSSIGILSLIILFALGALILYKTPKIAFEKSYLELIKEKKE
jgi:MFS transporter, UMF1 family